MKKILFPLLLILVLYFFGCESQIKSDSLPLYNYKNENINTPTSVISAPSIELKDNVNIQVPFASQAPNANWSEPYQDACEETSIIMANEFVSNNQNSDMDKNDANEKILNLVGWQEKNWGGHFDLDAAKTLELMQNYFGTNSGEIKTIQSIDDLKQILSDGKIIIAPTFGQALNNPYFTAPGPVYHMLVVKGYDKENFITNDPGVWQGKDFKYSHQNLFDSIFDLPAEAVMKSGFIKDHKDLMQSGAKNVIVVSR